MIIMRQVSTAILGFIIAGPGLAQSTAIRDRQEPASIVLVCDAGSRWGAGPGLSRQPALVSRFARDVASRMISGDQFRVMTAATTIQVSPRWFHDPQLLAKEIAAVQQNGGPSPIWDAVYDAAGLLELERTPRLILLMSDGRASANVHGFEAARARVTRAGIVVHAAAPQVRVRQPGEKSQEPVDRLRRLAIETGGVFGEVREANTGKFFSDAIVGRASIHR